MSTKIKRYIRLIQERVQPMKNHLKQKKNLIFGPKKTKISTRMKKMTKIKLNIPRVEYTKNN